jgi:MSHA biogenesis protein MshI
LFNLWRRNEVSNRRTGLVRTASGCAIATVQHKAGGRFHLESCKSVQGSSTVQNASISEWLHDDSADLGAVSSILDEHDYQLLLVEAPDVLPAELKAAVRWRLKDAIDFPVEDAVVDVFGIPEPARRTGAKMTYAIAAKRQAVESQVAIFKGTSLRFDVIDIPEMALRNLVSQMPEAEEGLILLWMSPQSAELFVLKQSTLYLSRKVHFGNSDLHFSLEHMPEVEAIALELQRSMDYYESHYEQSPIGHLIIAPQTAHSKVLAEQLAAQTSMEIQTIDVSRALDLAVEVDASDPRSLLAIGAAMRNEHKKS